jgi:hypothetical protein
MSDRITILASTCVEYAQCALQGGCTSLHWASFSGHLDVVRYLIEKCGADVHAKNKVSELSLCSKFTRIPTPSDLIVIAASELNVWNVSVRRMVVRQPTLQLMDIWTWCDICSRNVELLWMWMREMK